MPSELPPSSHIPTSEEWTAELAAGLCFAVSATGFETMWVDPTGFETLRLNHLATPPVETEHTKLKVIVFCFSLQMTTK